MWRFGGDCARTARSHDPDRPEPAGAPLRRLTDDEDARMKYVAPEIRIDSALCD
jgi:hypothetical protein